MISEGSQEKVEDPIPISFFQKLSPMSKKLPIQITILSLISVASFFVIYYVTYQDYIDYLVHDYQLPYNLGWMIIVASGLAFLALILSYFSPIGEKFIEEQQILNEFDKTIEKATNSLNEFDFQKAQLILENYLDQRHKFRIKKGNEELLNLLDQAQISGVIKKKVKRLKQSLNEDDIFETKKQFEEFIEFYDFYKPRMYRLYQPQVEDIIVQIDNIKL